MQIQKTLLRFLTALICGCFLSQAGFAAGVFREINLESARAAAQKESKLLIIDFTASWCGPCHKMERTTWSNPSVQKWIAENAVAVQFDVDKEKDISQSFKIMAMPSLVVFTTKDFSKEFDRQVGYQTSEELLGWLEGVQKGETSLDQMKHAVEKLAGKGGETEVKARYKLARTLADANMFADATEQYVWLWQQIPTQLPSAGGVRISSIAAEISMLSSRFPAAKQRFETIRDESLKKNEYLDFISLNESLNENEKTLAWFDSMKDNPKAADAFKSVNFVLEGMLIKKGRWKDIMILYPDPLAEIKELAAKSPLIAQQMAKMGIKIDPFVRDAARLYAAALVADRESDARKIANTILELRDSAEMRKQLVLTAIEAGEPRKDQLKWIKDNADLSSKLQQALKNTKSK